MLIANSKCRSDEISRAMCNPISLISRVNSFLCNVLEKSLYIATFPFADLTMTWAEGRRKKESSSAYSRW